MTQGLQIYDIARFIQLRKDKVNCHEEDKSNLLKHFEAKKKSGLKSRDFSPLRVNVRLFPLDVSYLAATIYGGEF